MKYTVWDKSTPIDGRTSAYIHERHPGWAEDTVYIIRQDDGMLIDIIALSALPNPDGYVDADAIVTAYIETLQNGEMPLPSGSTDTEMRLAAVEDELNDLAKAIERGLSL